MRYVSFIFISLITLFYMGCGGSSSSSSNTTTSEPATADIAPASIDFMLKNLSFVVSNRSPSELYFSLVTVLRSDGIGIEPAAGLTYEKFSSTTGRVTRRDYDGDVWQADLTFTTGTSGAATITLITAVNGNINNVNYLTSVDVGSVEVGTFQIIDR